MVLQQLFSSLEIIDVHANRIYVPIDVRGFDDVHTKAVRIFHAYADQIFTSVEAVFLVAPLKTELLEQFDGVLRVRRDNKRVERRDFH